MYCIFWKSFQSVECNKIFICFHYQHINTATQTCECIWCPGHWSYIRSQRIFRLLRLHYRTSTSQLSCGPHDGQTSPTFLKAFMRRPEYKFRHVIECESIDGRSDADEISFQCMQQWRYLEQALHRLLLLLNAYRTAHGIDEGPAAAASTSPCLYHFAIIRSPVVLVNVNSETIKYMAVMCVCWGF